MYEAPVAFVFAGLGSAVTGSALGGRTEEELASRDAAMPEVELD